MNSGFKNINGALIYYERRGEGKIVVFIHGFSLDHRLWNPQFDVFAGHYDCIRYDMRGFGKSSLPEKKAKYTHHDDLHALLNSLGVIEPVALIGLSLGGRVAVNFTLEYPEMVSALVIVDGVVDGFEYRYMDINKIYETGIKEGPLAANKKWISHPLFEPAMKNKHSANLLTAMLTEYSGWHWSNRNPLNRISAEAEAIDRLDEVKAPTLIVLGGNETQDFKDVAGIMQKGIVHSEMKFITGAGHISSLEQPAEFNMAVLDFLQTHL